MASAHFTIAVTYHGVWWHKSCGWVACLSFDHEPGVLHLVFDSA